MRFCLAVVIGPVLLACARPAVAQQVSSWDTPIAEASARFGIPVAWIRRVIHAESGGRTTLNGRPIRSRVGAMGLMQLMPGTWQAMRRAHGLGADPDDPRDNILAGTAYLRAMYDRFGYPGLFAAYNAGPARYADHLSRGRRLPSETIAYVAQVARSRAGWAQDAPAAGGALLASGLLLPRSSAPPASADIALTDRPEPSVFFRLGEIPRR